MIFVRCNKSIAILCSVFKSIVDSKKQVLRSMLEGSMNNAILFEIRKNICIIYLRVFRIMALDEPLAVLIGEVIVIFSVNLNVLS